MSSSSSSSLPLSLSLPPPLITLANLYHASVVSLTCFLSPLSTPPGVRKEICTCWVCGSDWVHRLAELEKKYVVSLAHLLSILSPPFPPVEDLLFSYNIAVDRSDEMEKKPRKSMARLGFQLDNW